MLTQTQQIAFLDAVEEGPDAAALQQALQRNPQLVWSEASAFWDETDLKASARTWSTYWSRRTEVFEGEALAFKAWDECLTEEHYECLRAGTIVQLPDDNDGDAVICVDRARQIVSPPLQIRLQAAFYMLSQLLHRKSVVLLFHLSVRATFNTPVNHHLTDWVQEAFPFKLKHVHIAGCPPHKSARRFFEGDMVPNAVHSCGPAAKPLAVHSGDSKRELLKKLKKLGFRKDSLPRCVGGKWDYASFESWLKAKQEKPNGSSAAPCAQQDEDKKLPAKEKKDTPSEEMDRPKVVPSAKSPPKSPSTLCTLATVATRNLDAADTKGQVSGFVTKTQGPQLKAAPPSVTSPQETVNKSVMNAVNAARLSSTPQVNQERQQTPMSSVSLQDQGLSRQQQHSLIASAQMDSLLHSALRNKHYAARQQLGVGGNLRLDSSSSQLLAFLASARQSSLPVTNFLTTQRREPFFSAQQFQLSQDQLQQHSRARLLNDMSAARIAQATADSGTDFAKTTRSPIPVQPRSVVQQQQQQTVPSPAKPCSVQYTAVLQTIRLLPALSQAAYLEAVRLAPQLVERESPVASFWKICQGNVVAAAQRLTSYWTNRKALFRDRWLRAMTCTGEGALSRDDTLVLFSGSISVLPPNVLYFDRSRCLKGECSTEARLRCLFYLVHALQNEKEVLFLNSLITPHVSPLDEDFLLHASRLAFQSLPVDVSKWHFTVCPPKSGKKRAVEQIISRTMRAVTLARARVLRGSSPVDFVGQLTALGITSLPPSLGGVWKFENFGKWLRDRSVAEQRLCGGSDGSPQETPEERKERKRLLNIIHSRQKRERRRGEMEGLQQQQHDLTRENKRLKMDNARLEEAVTEAQVLVKRIEGVQDGPSESAVAPPELQQQHSRTTMELAHLLRDAASQPVNPNHVSSASTDSSS